MTTETYLNHAIRFERMIKNKTSEMLRYQDLATSVSVNNESERVQTSGNKDKIGEFASRIIDMQKEIQDLTIMRDTIINQIESMEENPDLTISLLSGKKVVVREKPDEIIDRIVKYRRKIGINQEL